MFNYATLYASVLWTGCHLHIQCFLIKAFKIFDVVQGINCGELSHLDACIDNGNAVSIFLLSMNSQNVSV